MSRCPTDITWTLKGDAEEVGGENIKMGIKRSDTLGLKITEIDDNDANGANETIDGPQKSRRPNIIAHGPGKTSEDPHKLTAETYAC